ncbi:MAG: LysR family transcriptional regulator, partial [Slackia sp.]|nr:LysR family transcriptional regulator [Slackia sp.]
MDIRQLEYVVETAKRGSYTKAADALFVSRQGLSKAVKNLEKEIGQSLFQGLNGHLKTTSMGEAFIQEASPIVSSFKNLNERFTRQNSKQAPKMLSVAAAHGVMLSL